MGTDEAKARAIDAVAGLGSTLIPGVGGALSNLLVGENLRRLEQDIRARLDELALRVNENDIASKAMFASEEGRAAFLKVANQVRTEANDEKRRLLANALINGFGMRTERDQEAASERNYFMELVLAYEPEAMEVLAHSIHSERRGDFVHPVRGSVAANFGPSRHYLPRLEADGLLETTIRGLGDGNHADSPLDHRYSCTLLGWRFLEMVDPDFLKPKRLEADGQ